MFNFCNVRRQQNVLTIADGSMLVAYLGLICQSASKKKIRWHFNYYNTPLKPPKALKKKMNS